MAAADMCDLRKIVEHQCLALKVVQGQLDRERHTLFRKSHIRSAQGIDHQVSLREVTGPDEELLGLLDRPPNMAGRSPAPSQRSLRDEAPLPLKPLKQLACAIPTGVCHRQDVLQKLRLSSSLAPANL